MSVISKEELLNKIKTILGERTDDEALTLLEDATDTITDSTNWKEKYDEIDASWRKRYRERFEQGGTPEPTPTPESQDNNSPVPEPEEEKPLTYEALFQTGEGEN